MNGHFLSEGRKVSMCCFVAMLLVCLDLTRSESFEFCQASSRLLLMRLASSKLLRASRVQRTQPQCRLTDIGSLNGGLWGLESKTNILVPSAAVLASAGRLDLDLRVKEDVWLLLEGALSLDVQFGGHFCGWWMSRWSKVVGNRIQARRPRIAATHRLQRRLARRD